MRLRHTTVDENPGELRAILRREAAVKVASGLGCWDKGLGSHEASPAPFGVRLGTHDQLGRFYASLLCAGALKRPRAVQEVHDVAFVRLEPVELCGRNGPEVQAIDVVGIKEITSKRRIVRDAGPNERRADPAEHFILRALHDGNKREHELLTGNGVIGRLAVDRCR